MKNLHIDIETFSSVDLPKCGAYKYFESPDFEILILAYAFDNDRVTKISIAEGAPYPIAFLNALHDTKVKKHAHNATFERNAFKRVGFDIPVSNWYCSAVQAAYCGMPLGLGQLSEALGLGADKAKSAAGRALIKFFSVPITPTKKNGYKTRNYATDDYVKWQEYLNYCAQDVEAEREVLRILDKYNSGYTERALYLLDQQINDRGVMIDLPFVTQAVAINEVHSKIILDEIRLLTGVLNPKSVQQLCSWISQATNKEIKKLAKEDVLELIESVEDETVLRVLRLRQLSSKTSISKYTAMLKCIGSDGRGRGFFQFYGAMRTGRFAGRLVQLQNLTRNYLRDLEFAKNEVLTGDYDNLQLLFGNVADTLSQLVRTSFVAKDGHTFAVADFSAIEARVTAWLADETWRLKVFNSHGKIYEASAANMFGIPIETITKDSEYRQKGKVAELALGYGGSIGALIAMGGDKMGLSEDEMKDIVKRWRKASPAIPELWASLEKGAKECVQTGRAIEIRQKGITFQIEEDWLTILLPSGRKLFYREPQVRTKTVRREGLKNFETTVLSYMGLNDKSVWGRIDAWGGKWCENVVQAIARDLLCETMLELDYRQFQMVMHVHDEVVCEVPVSQAEEALHTMCEVMGKEISWAQGLPLSADGYITQYYKKA